MVQPRGNCRTRARPHVMAGQKLTYLCSKKKHTFLQVVYMKNTTSLMHKLVM